jgi:aspartyl protease
LGAGNPWKRSAFRLRYQYRASKSGIEIPITISAGSGRTAGVVAKVDTGAAACIFQREHAEALGIDVESGKEEWFSTATGRFNAYGHTVTLSCFDCDFEALVYFAHVHDFPRNVLGLQGWLDKLRFGLVHHDELLLLSLYDDVS